MIDSKKFPIKLVPHSEDRMFEVMASMRKLKMETCIFRSGVPTLTVQFWNEGGTVLYHYRHSGLIGMDALEARLDKIRKEAKNERVTSSN